jgi:hypothetical protein
MFWDEIKHYNSRMYIEREEKMEGKKKTPISISENLNICLKGGK